MKLQQAIEIHRARRASFPVATGCAFHDEVSSVIADAYLADLAARKAEERERAIPIDEEWLQTIGFIESAGELVIESVWHKVRVEVGKVKLFNRQAMQGATIGLSAFTTRGMMLDFLAGLKIPMKDAA